MADVNYRFRHKRLGRFVLRVFICSYFGLNRDGEFCSLSYHSNLFVSSLMQTTVIYTCTSDAVNRNVAPVIIAKDAKSTLLFNLFQQLDDPKVLPGYHFRDDAILLYEAINKYVKAYVGLYYGKFVASIFLVLSHESLLS